MSYCNSEFSECTDLVMQMTALSSTVISIVHTDLVMQMTSLSPTVNSKCIDLVMQMTALSLTVISNVQTYLCNCIVSNGSVDVAESCGT